MKLIVNLVDVINHLMNKRIAAELEMNKTIKSLTLQLDEKKKKYENAIEINRQMGFPDTIEQIEMLIRNLEREHEQGISKIQTEYHNVLTRIDKAIESMMELNEACIKCGGTGKEYFTDGAGDTDYMICSRCDGRKREPDRQ